MLRSPGEKETEILNLTREIPELREDCVACMGFDDHRLTVFSCRPSGGPPELPLYAPPAPEPLATPREQYDAAIRTYIEHLREKEASEGREGKIVGARVISAPPVARRYELFDHLRRLYRDAFVFYLSTPRTGTWAGASPELLLRRKGNRMHTMALAGTRPAGSEGEWSEKNIREQRMVTEFITETMRRHGLEPQCSDTATRSAGPVEHIVTEISCDIPEEWSLEDTAALVTDLSPTPALCGLPRDDARQMLSLHEPFSRHLYGGCIGRVKTNDDWCFFVNLRSALLTGRRSHLYCGGGITSLSDPGAEWEETEFKAMTLLKVIAPESIHVPGTPLPPIRIRRRRRRSRQ